MLLIETERKMTVVFGRGMGIATRVGGAGRSVLLLVSDVTKPTFGFEIFTGTVAEVEAAREALQAVVFRCSGHGVAWVRRCVIDRTLPAGEPGEPVGQRRAPAIAGMYLGENGQPTTATKIEVEAWHPTDCVLAPDEPFDTTPGVIQLVTVPEQWVAEAPPTPFYGVVQGHDCDGDETRVGVCVHAMRGRGAAMEILTR